MAVMTAVAAAPAAPAPKPENAAQTVPAGSAPRPSSRPAAPFFRATACLFPRRPVELRHHEAEDSK